MLENSQKENLPALGIAGMIPGFFALSMSLINYKINIGNYKIHIGNYKYFMNLNYVNLHNEL